MAEIEIRVLQPADESALHRFLETRPHTTMFLRSNSRRAGLLDRGEFAQGTYAAAYRGGEIVASAAHYWQGNLVLDCPVALARVARKAVEASGRPLAGLLGPWAQCEEARSALAAGGRAARTESREELLALDLSALRVPAELANGSVVCRRPSEAEVDGFLTEWRLAFDVESLGAEASDERRASNRASLRQARADRCVWLLEHEGRAVSMCGFNAALPDCVQIGGVYTPPEARSRGFARSVVAGSLLDAGARGVQRSILFTGEENEWAQSCYRALGYERVGDYGLILFE